MKLQIERKSGNVRFGSRKWAKQLKGCWAWELTRRGDGSDRIDISCGKRCVASFDALDVSQRRCGRGFNTVEGSAEYGGAPIGEALYSDLFAFAKCLDMSEDDEHEIVFSLGRSDPSGD
jgi:hypothetical protein